MSVSVERVVAPALAESMFRTGTQMGETFSSGSFEQGREFPLSNAFGSWNIRANE